MTDESTATQNPPQPPLARTRSGNLSKPAATEQGKGPAKGQTSGMSSPKKAVITAAVVITAAGIIALIASLNSGTHVPGSRNPVLKDAGYVTGGARGVGLSR